MTFTALQVHTAHKSHMQVANFVLLLNNKIKTKFLQKYVAFYYNAIQCNTNRQQLLNSTNIPINIFGL